MNTRPDNLSNAASAPTCFVSVARVAVFRALATGTRTHAQPAADTPEDPQTAAPATPPVAGRLLIVDSLGSAFPVQLEDAL